jgi:phytoene dehydrogenase-like protein
VVGAGPNGLVAAVVLARAGWDVTVLEAQDRPGGGTRSAELTLPGVVHDVCSAIHPLALASPAFRRLDGDGAFAAHGLEWIHPEVPLAHPLDGGRAVILARDVGETADGLGRDADAYRHLFERFVAAGRDLSDGLLSPLTVPPRHPLTLARYASVGIRSATGVASRRFETEDAKALFAGLAAHSVLPLDQAATAGYAVLLGALAHTVGWPMASGGSQRVADALVAMLTQADGRIECGHPVTSLGDLPPSDAVLLDVTPRQFLAIAGDAVTGRHRRALERFRFGPGVFKLDLTLDGPIPWADPDCARAATVHVGGTLDDIATSEAAVHGGRHPERPFVLLAQQTLFDRSRAPTGTHTVWSYCHVPNGSTVDMTQAIEAQIERFAPGFRERIVARHTMNTAAVERHGANYIGGDITGGVADLRQFLARPTLGLHPWRTSLDGVYLCSSSTPPGAGVHGMCGWHAAHQVLRDQRH